MDCFKTRKITSDDPHLSTTFAKAYPYPNCILIYFLVLSIDIRKQSFRFTDTEGWL